MCVAIGWQALRDQAAKEQEWRSQGHGTYHEIGDEKDWFQECKSNERLVCHFYRSTTKYCEVVDKHLQKLAPEHLETRFVKINAEKCPFLVQRLKIVVMPTIVCTKDNYTADMIEGFTELGNTADFTTLALAQRLAKNGILFYDKVEAKWNKKQAKAKTYNVVTSNPTGKAIYKGNLAAKLAEWDADDSDEDFWKDDDDK